MTIIAELADGTELEFPEGTDPGVIQSAVKKYIGNGDEKIAPVIPTKTAQSHISGPALVSSREGLPSALTTPITEDISVHDAPEIEGKGPNALNNLVGGLEVAGTVASGAVAEPLAGLAGVAALTTGDPNKAKKAVEVVRSALTMEPKTKAGREILAKTGKMLEPVGEAMTSAEEFLGDKTFEVTGSPAMAALATTAPTAIIEFLGLKGSKMLTKKLARVKAKRLKGIIDAEVLEATPSVERLKETARGVYREIDEIGGEVKPDKFFKMVGEIEDSMIKKGLDLEPTLGNTPKALRLVKRLEEQIISGKRMSVTDFDIERKAAQQVAKSADATEALLGDTALDIMDKFLDNTDSIQVPKGTEAIGKKYRIARNMWGKAKRSEMIQRAFEKARNAPSGFAKGIEVQFRSILNNDKKIRYFNKAEVDAMQKIVRKPGSQNLLNLLGKLSIGGEGSTLFGGTLGAAIGAKLFGPVGAVAVPVVGVVSKKLGARLVKGRAMFADQVIRAGKNATKIAEAYIANTPKKLRNADELSQLLMRSDINLERLPQTPFFNESINLALSKREALAAIVVPELAKMGQSENQPRTSTISKLINETLK